MTVFALCADVFAMYDMAEIHRLVLSGKHELGREIVRDKTKQHESRNKQGQRYYHIDSV
jgi:hypothetical protein